MAKKAAFTTETYTGRLLLEHWGHACYGILPWETFYLRFLTPDGRTIYWWGNKAQRVYEDLQLIIGDTLRATSKIHVFRVGEKPNFHLVNPKLVVEG